ncbi:hypothetical protein EDD11_005061 [Mortierella claussenii]|nr:hypothetical protein EDD11_005061 [Mortierella claussenii]
MQPEILEYVRAAAKTYNIYDRIKFNTRVSSMQWHEGRNKWVLRWIKKSAIATDLEEVQQQEQKKRQEYEEKVEEGDHEVDVVIHAAGVLRLPNIPKESDAFEGPKWHSARWDHSVDLTGKRVGLVGAMARMRRKLTPKYELGSRRIAVTDTYYPTLKKPQVHLHQNAISSVQGNAIETVDGSKQELDILVLATGYDRVSNFPIGYWKGRNGIDIAKQWNGSPTTYYGTCVPSAPNFFLIWGPNSSVPHHALTGVFEAQVMYTMRVLSHMMENDLATMEIKQEATEDFLQHLDRRMESMVSTASLPHKSIENQGKTRSRWNGSITELRWKLRHVHPERYHVVRRGGVHDKIDHL